MHEWKATHLAWLGGGVARVDGVVGDLHNSVGFLCEGVNPFAQDFPAGQVFVISHLPRDELRTAVFELDKAAHVKAVEPHDRAWPLTGHHGEQGDPPVGKGLAPVVARTHAHERV